MSFIDAVIFDLDGLLLDSERLALQDLAALSRDMGLEVDPHVFTALIGLNSKNSASKLCEIFGADFPAGEIMEKQRALSLARRAPLKAGARDLLSWVQEQGVSCALATSTRREKVEQVLAHHGIRSRFQAIVCGDEVSRGKPNPEIYEKAARSLGVPPKDCLALEDSGPGVRSALAAGMRVIHIPDIMDIGPELRARAFAVRPSLDETRPVLAGLLRTDVLDFLHSYAGIDDADQAQCSRVLDFVRRNPRCCERSEIEGHITASAWLVDCTGERVLLTHHRKLERWLQLGGHADGERAVLDVALREAREESGLAEIRPRYRALFDVDVHEIPARGDDPAHLHYDLRFVLQASAEHPFRVSDESLDLQWIAIERLHEVTDEPSLLRMRKKWLSRPF